MRLLLHNNPVFLGSADSRQPFESGKWHLDQEKGANRQVQVTARAQEGGK